MKLPLTLAIIDGILVRVGDRDFVIPTVSVVESIRPERSAYNSVKIIMTTALGNKDNILQAFNEQCEAYLVKPINKQELFKHLGSLGLLEQTTD